MMIERPNLDNYIAMMDEYAELRNLLADKEYEREKMVASFIDAALKRGAKTKELDVVKVLGNNESDREALDEITHEINVLKKRITKQRAKLDRWAAQKDLYISDSYHQFRGKGSFFNSDGE